MPDATDKAATAYSSAYEKAIQSVRTRYPALAKRSADEVAEVLGNLDFDALFRQSYGMNDALENLTRSFVKGILVVPAPPILPSTQPLSVALQFQVDAANSQITQSAAEIKKIMMNSILGNQSEAEFAAALQTETLTTSQINSYANQNLRTFHRTVENQMASANPESTYIWDGPLDAVTSDLCAQMIAEGARPYSFWATNYSAYLTSGTHYGCRHTLQMFVQSVQLENTVKARALEGEV